MKIYKIKNTALIYISLCIIFIFFPAFSKSAYGVWTITENSVNFTIKPGERVSDICARLSMYGLCSVKALTQIAEHHTFKEYPFVPPPMSSIRRFEGLFTPGNYTFHFKSRKYFLYPEKTTYLILKLLLSKSADRFKQLQDTKKLTVYQQIILASIVEKEAVAHRDYCKIASVFFNRLKAHMPLASCPALEYALGYHRPFLTRKDTMLNSPYNLYRHRGLPPTPIATFSDQALKCVTHPIQTGFYFFVYDWVTNECYFSYNYMEHMHNVQKAKNDYILRYGRDKLFKKYPGKFYEP